MFYLEKSRVSMALFAVFLLGLAGSFLACAPGSDYRQFSGRFQLIDAKYLNSQGAPDPSLTGKKPPPFIDITHYIEGNGFFRKDWVLIEALPESSDQATGSFSGRLDRFLNKGRGCVGTAGACEFGGEPFRDFKPHATPTGGQAGTFCNFYGYSYIAHIDAAALVPSLDAWNQIFAIGSQRESTGAQAWDAEVAKNGGLTVVFTLKKLVNSDYAGCAPGVFPQDDFEHDTGKIILKYHAAVGEEDYSQNPAEMPGSEEVDFKASGPTKANLFDQLTRFL